MGDSACANLINWGFCLHSLIGLFLVSVSEKKLGHSGNAQVKLKRVKYPDALEACGKKKYNLHNAYMNTAIQLPLQFSWQVLFVQVFNMY